MGVLIALVGVTWAGVSVLDPTGCLDADRLENESRLLLGDPMVDGLEITVWVTGDEPGVRTTTTVRERGTRLWSRELAAVRADCPALPEALALSIQQGLAALPGWSFAQARPRRPSWTADLAGSAGSLSDIRFGLQVGVGYPVAQTLEIWSELRARASTPATLGDGTATMVTAAIAAGVDHRVPLGSAVFTAGGGLIGGPLWATGKGFDLNGTAIAPRVAVLARVAMQPPGPLRLGLTLEIPVLRVQLVEIGGDQLTEAPVRLGLTLGLHVGPERTNRFSE